MTDLVKQLRTMLPWHKEGIVCRQAADEIESLRQQVKELGAYPSKEITWLFTHCKAIGMTCKSDSGKWEEDRALFTINLQAELAALKDEIKQDAEGPDWLDVEPFFDDLGDIWKY